MNEQERISIGKTESRETQTTISQRTGSPQSFIGQGSFAKMAAWANRAKMKPPAAVRGACWIPLSKGIFALVDADVAERVNQKFWTAIVNKKSKTCYALFRDQASKKTVFLHNWLVKVPKGMVIDHINGDGLDCRRSNMRICLPAENKRNNGKWHSKTSSTFKGVHYAPRYRLKWAVAIGVNHKTIHVGRFATEIEAAQAYDAAARKHFGKFARPNVQ